MSRSSRFGFVHEESEDRRLVETQEGREIFGEAALHEESIQGAVGRGLQGQWTEGR